MSASASTQYMDIPSDRWRDDVFSCFRFGCFHPVFCLGLFCFPIPLGQVMTRMNLTWIGDRRDPETQTIRVSAFKVVALILAIYLGGLYATSQSLWKELWELSLPIFLPMSWWDFLFWVYCFLVVMKTRSYIRRKYSIPEQTCNGCEDCCCAFFCLPLTICQMARHTADYDTYRASACSENGLPRNAPHIV
jgi:Cys-rich protein (TIGR01571 family)